MNNSLRLCFFGDFVAPTVDSLEIGDKLKSLISHSDINVLNFEAPVKSIGKPIKKSGPNLYQSAEAPKWIENNGFNLITLSNNHLFDYGEIGYKETVSHFNSSILVGAGIWDEAYKPIVLEIKGYKLAFLSLTHFEFGTLTDSFEKDNIGCAWINHPYVDNIIGNIRREVDFLFLLLHAGVENVEQPLPEWRERYRSFIDLGCDAVIASHPHIPQGWEEYKGKPIFYSLGNFYFPKDYEKPWYWYRSLCVSMLIEDNKLSYKVEPLFYNKKIIDICRDTIIENYMSRIQDTLQDYDKYMEEINKICQQHLPIYYNLFYNGGLLELRFNIQMIKRFIRFILGRVSIKEESLINNLRCESHRWCLSRALHNKYNIK